jgi:hypothetical protein
MLLQTLTGFRQTPNSQTLLQTLSGFWQTPNSQTLFQTLSGFWHYRKKLKSSFISSACYELIKYISFAASL